MKIERIQLKNFRNITSLDVSLCENANIIYGENGQGKTNLIEAIWLFTGAKSFRGAKDSQMVQFGVEQAELELSFFASGRTQSASITIESRRRACLNEIPLKSASELAGAFCAVVFSPTDLTLIKNGPQEKRRFMDAAICQVKPRYLSVSTNYLRVIAQRNHLLKDGSSVPGYADLLDIWDARLASYGAVIVKTRATFLKRLLPFARETYRGISGEREQLDFSYASTLECDLQSSISEIEQSFLRCLTANRKEDERAGVSMRGPHRDDIDITLSGVSARAFGSQGQQRSCVLALKLAECELIRETIGEYPVVLLDDVMSELDASRREYLLNHLNERQLIMTCCDKAYFHALGNGVRVKLEKGAVAVEHHSKPL